MKKGRTGGNLIVSPCSITVLSHPICLLEALVTVCNPQCLNCRSHQRLHNTVLCQEKAVLSEIQPMGYKSRGQETPSNQTEKGLQLHMPKHSSPRPKQPCLLFGFASSCKLGVFIASLIKLLCLCISTISSYRLGCHLPSQPQSLPSGMQHENN